MNSHILASILYFFKLSKITFGALLGQGPMPNGLSDPLYLGLAKAVTLFLK
jgi:hypothetical protein